VISSNYTQIGATLFLEMELKKLCEADVFCMVLSKFYGSMFRFKLSGEANHVTSKISLESKLSDINLNDRYTIHDCALVLEIDYQSFEQPDINIFIKGNLKAYIQSGVELSFRTELRLTEAGTLEVNGVMDDILVNAFNLYNMLNVTSMTFSSHLNHDAQLQTIFINGVGIFG
jgi:hypothetical protein